MFALYDFYVGFVCPGLKSSCDATENIVFVIVVVRFVIVVVRFTHTWCL